MAISIGWGAEQLSSLDPNACAGFSPSQIGNIPPISVPGFISFAI